MEPDPDPEPGPGSTRRRRVAWIALALAGLLIVSSLAAAFVTARPPDRDPLVVLSGHDDSPSGVRRQLIAKWNSEHDSNSQVNLVELSSIADAQRAEMLATAQSGATVDVYNLDVTWTAEFADAGYIRALNRFRIPTADFIGAPLQTCRYRRQLWALPFNTDVGLLYYNKRLLGSNDPPKDWATLQRLTEQLAPPGGDIAGYIGQYGDYEGLTVTALELVWGAGGKLIGPDGTVLPDAPAVLAGLDRLRAIGPQDVPEYNEATSIDAFGRETAVFLRNWPVAYLRLMQDRDGAPPPDIGVAPLPGYSGALGGQNLAISASSDRPELARDLIEFLTSAESQRSLLAGWLPATRRSAYTDPPFPDPAQREVAGTLLDALEHANSRPTLPHYALFSDTFRAAVDRYLRTRVRPDESDLRARLDAARLGRVVAPDRT